MGTEVETLESFAQWFFTQRLMAMTPVALYDYGGIRSLVLHRSAPFQVELFMVAPGAGFPVEHRHPHVDSIEVDMFGEIRLTVNGKRRRPTAIIRQDGGRTYCLNRVRETDWHGASIMSNGGAFLSIQQWHTGVLPTSVGLDWEGIPVSKEHAGLQGVEFTGAP
jgi:hypothetical protein